MYNKTDLKQFRKRGIKSEQIDKQIENFKNGFDFAQIESAATIGDGIIKLSEEKVDELVGLFENKRTSKDMVKMVPASGSASRMFKRLNTFRNSYTGSDEDFLKFRQDKEVDSPFSFFEKLKEYPFYIKLKEALYEDRLDVDKMLWKNQYIDILDYILTEKGLNYNHTPKGLIDFHVYKDYVRTAVEEHLVEAVLYCNDNKTANLHFTVSEEHLKRFNAYVKSILRFYQKTYNIKFKITYSIQEPFTDTISLDENGEILRDKDGGVVFRPGGHGALIYNLNRLKEEIIFIKNIDNVTPDRNKADTVKYKKVLAGYLIEIQQKIFNYMKLLNKRNGVDDAKIREIEAFIRTHLGYRDEIEHTDRKKHIQYLKNLLDRPLRVCGMVKNEGEPGGGPFWVKTPESGSRLMILESAQINTKDKEQNKILMNSTHFNPVDLVCGVHNYRGKKYNLEDFIDKTQGFITTKSYDGKDIQVQELPGLWNGAMAKWNTIFIEVPLSTFTPVKTVSDLLRFEHRNVFKVD